MSLTFDDRDEEALSSGPDSQNNGYKGPSLCPRQSDTSPSSRWKSLRNHTKVTPTNRDSIIEQTLVDQGHTRQTRQSCNKYSNSSTVMPAPVHLQYQEGRPPVPSAPHSGNDSGTEQTLDDQGHTRQTHQSCNKYSNSSTVIPAPVRLQYQERRPPVPSAPDSGTDKMDIKSTFASNPKGLSLSQFDKLFKRNGMKLVTVPGNGFCFISCVLVTLAE